MPEWLCDQLLAFRAPRRLRPHSAPGRRARHLRVLPRSSAGGRPSRQGRLPGGEARDRGQRSHERRDDHAQTVLEPCGALGDALGRVARHLRGAAREPHLADLQLAAVRRGRFHRRRVRALPAAHQLRREPPQPRLRVGLARDRRELPDRARARASCASAGRAHAQPAGVAPAQDAPLTRSAARPCGGRASRPTRTPRR